MYIIIGGCLEQNIVCAPVYQRMHHEKDSYFIEIEMRRLHKELTEDASIKTCVEIGLEAYQYLKVSSVERLMTYISEFDESVKQAVAAGYRMGSAIKTIQEEMILAHDESTALGESDEELHQRFLDVVYSFLDITVAVRYEPMFFSYFLLTHIFAVVVIIIGYNHSYLKSTQYNQLRTVKGALDQLTSWGFDDGTAPSFV